MFDVVKDHPDITHPHAIKILNNFQGYTKGTLKKMEEKNWVEVKGVQWSLTKEGYHAADNLYKQ